MALDTTLKKVRLMIGDTDRTLLTDDEVQFHVDSWTGKGEEQSWTGEDVDDTVDLLDHGYGDGNRVLLSDLVGGVGLQTVEPYYVVNAEIDSFQLATRKSGPPVSFDSDVTDGAVARFLSRNLDLAAAGAAEAIAAKFARDYNFMADDQSFNRRERYLHYMELAREMRRRGGAFVWPEPDTAA